MKIKNAHALKSTPLQFTYKRDLYTLGLVYIQFKLDKQFMSVLDIDQSWNFWKLGWNQTLHKKFVLCTYLLMYLNNIRYAMEKDDESEE